MRSHVEKNLLSRQHARPALIQGHLKFFGSRVLRYFAEPAQLFWVPRERVGWTSALSPNSS